MNIWLINHYAVPRSGSSGTRHAVLAKHLADKGHRVTVFASPTSRAHINTLVKFNNNSIFADQEHDGCIFRFIRTLEYNNNVTRFFNMINFRKNILRSTNGLQAPDVVLGSCVHLHAADAGRILARRYKVPFIYEIRDIWPESLIDVGGMNRWHPVYLYLRSIELRLYREASHFITLLPGSNPYLQKHGIDTDKITYLPNGIDTELYPPLKPPANSDSFTALFFGAHGPANGLDTILHAAKKLQDNKNSIHIRIQFIGDGNSKPSLLKLRDELQLNNVEFFERMNKKELFIKAQQADAFIFHLKNMPVLQRYGVSANKLFDYLMCGRPVLFACNSYNDPVKEAGAGISIPPNNPDAMADALLHLSKTNHEERQAMGERGRKWVIKNHDLGKLAQRLEKVLVDITK